MLSALVLLAISLSCVWLGGYAFLSLVAACCAVLSGEWVAMCGYSFPDAPTVWMPAVIVSAALCGGLGLPGIGLLLMLAGTVAAIVFPAPPGRQGHDEASGWSQADGRDLRTATPTHPKFNLAFGLPYLGLAAVALPWLRADPEAGFANTLFVLSIVWASDIGAYMAGRLLGGPKLAPAISPGKTWSGAAGGLASATLTGVAAAGCFSPEISASHAIGPGLAFGIISQAGDLLESALKRHFAVKDSGRIIPGHGGLLDRLDAVLAVAPVAAVLAFTVGRGVVLWR